MNPQLLDTLGTLITIMLGILATMGSRWMAAQHDRIATSHTLGTLQNAAAIGVAAAAQYAKQQPGLSGPELKSLATEKAFTVAQEHGVSTTPAVWDPLIEHAVVDLKTMLAPWAATPLVPVVELTAPPRTQLGGAVTSSAAPIAVTVPPATVTKRPRPKVTP